MSNIILNMRGSNSIYKIKFTKLSCTTPWKYLLEGVQKEVKSRGMYVKK
jgi:hypothetical protein